MTATPAVRPFALRHSRALSFLLWGAVLGQASVLAQTSVPPPAPAAGKSPDKPADDFWWSDRYDKVRYSNPSNTSHYFFTEPTATAAGPVYVFFPPVVPPLGVDFPVLGRLVPGAPAAPPELAAFVNELFYPLLAARLAANDLPKALGPQLQAYRATRTELLNELRARIAELRDGGLPSREQQLAALAVRQAPKIAALEAAAEKIRMDLQPTGIFGFRAENDPPEGPTPAAGKPNLQLESRFMRHAAFHARGLSLGQRRLLLEAAIELESQPDPGPAPVRPAGEDGLLRFSPEPARITVPAGLPPLLEKLITGYVAAKNELKAELHDALLGGKPAGEQALAQLALAQAARFAAIEVTAEEIRRGLAQLPNPPGPPPPPALPPELTVRISTYRQHKVELLRTLHGMLAGGRENAAAKAGAPRPGALTVMSERANAAQNKPLNLQESVAEFNRRQTVLIAELNKETAGIREALAEFVRTTGRPDDRKSIDDLLKDFETARQKQEVWDKFRDYQVAVLMPGLSPEQRRLLFDAAVEQLALPLPSGQTVR